MGIKARVRCLWQRKCAESPPGRQTDLLKVIRPITVFSLLEFSGNRKDVSALNTEFYSRKMSPNLMPTIKLKGSKVLKQ